MKYVLIDLTRYQDKCGFGEIANNVGEHLKGGIIDDIHFTVLVLEKYKGVLGDAVDYVTVEHLDKDLKALGHKIDLWHTTDQLFIKRRHAKGMINLLTVHDLNFLFEKKGIHRLKRLLKLKWFVKRSDCITVISEYVKRDLLEHVNLGKKPLRVIYNGIHLRPGRSGWGVKRFSALNDAISHYRSLPMDGVRVLGMADDAHAYELIRCVRLFPGDAQGEDVLAADHWRNGLTKMNAALKDALDICLESLRPRFLLEPERLIPVPQRKKLRKELREALLWQSYEENYDSAIRAVFVGGVGWLSPQDVKKQRQLPLVLRYRVDGMTKDGAYLSLEVELWEYDLLLEQTRDHYKMKKRG